MRVMATENSIQLDPGTEARFLDTQLALYRKQASGATGQQLAVIAHYQSEAEMRRERIARVLAARKRRARPQASRAAHA